MWIELAPEEYRVRLRQREVKMYCFSLSIDGKVGWREPTTDELYQSTKAIDYGSWISVCGFWSSDGYSLLFKMFGWPWERMNDYELNQKRWVVPVRTLPDTHWFGRLIYRWKGYRYINPKSRTHKGEAFPWN